MNQDQMNLLHRIFAVNEQVVKQNHQIMTVLTQPTISASGQWVELTNEELNACAAGGHNGVSVQSAILKAQGFLKEKNG